MRPYTATELKALDWYATKNSLQLTLGQPPIMWFIQQDGDTHKRHLDHIVNEYKQRKEDEKREIA